MLLVGPLIFLLGSFTGTATAGNTTCVSTELDWYTNVVGETPCRTYERLRQICNQNYEVGDFRDQTPGDNCDDQLPECCCNSIAWALSMLCMNCQKCAQGPACIDAGKTAYEMYRANSGGGTCSDRTSLVNNNFTADIESAACNKGIRIPQTLYNLYWDDGAWFFAYTRDITTKEFNAEGDGAFHSCPSPSSSLSLSPSSTTLPAVSGITRVPTSVGSSPTPSVATSNQSESSSSSVNAGAIAGGVVGGVVGLALLGGAFFFWKRRNPQARPQSLEINYPTPHHPQFHPSPPMHQVVGNPSVFSSTDAQSSAGASSVVNGAPLPYSKRSMMESQSHAPHPSAAQWSSSGYDGDDDDRHTDGGAVLGRSPSGRLPPSYGQWS